MRVARVAVVVLVVLAGCGGFGDPTPTTSPTSESETASPTGTVTPTATASPAPTGTETAAPTRTSTATEADTATATDTATASGDLSADNPWNQRIVRVAVNDTADDGRNTTAIAQRSIEYWNANVDRYTAYDFRFRRAEDPDEARVEIRFVDGIDECDGPTTHTAGCARVIGPDETAREREVARVVSNRSNSLVTGTTKHELGHLLGLDHGDEPRFIMAQNSTTPVRDATERANPWFADTLSVDVEYGHVDGDRDVVDSQVNHAVAFYEDGADGTIPRNVSFERTDQRHAADVVVTNDPARCDLDGGSRLGLEGQNGDDDPEFEAYTRAIVCVDVDEDAVGWHVGYWLGTAFGLSTDELAPVFRDAGYRERRGDWWE